jgi:ABC-type nitrate/sulfonate/bicarbonate transport system substrate-binding protein
MNRRLLNGLVLATAWLSAGGAFAQAAAAPQKIKIQHYPGALLSIVAYVGVEQKIFQKHGLDPELVGIATGPDAMAALLSSGVDVMLNSGDNLMRALEKGSPDMKIVVGNSRQMPFSVVARNDIPLAAGGFEPAMKSLLGKKMGVIQRGSSTEIIFRSMFTAAGLNPNDAIWVGVGGVGTAMPALQNQVIDAYLAFEPFQTMTVNQTKSAHIVADLRKGQVVSGFADFPYNFYIARGDDLRTRPEVMPRIVDAFVESHAFIQDPQRLDAVLDSAGKYIKMDRALLRQMVQDNLPTFGATVPDAAIAKWISFARDSLGVKRAFKPTDLLAKGLIPQ